MRGRERPTGPAGWAACARAEAGWPARAEQVKPTRPSSSFFFFCFTFLFHCLNFKFGLEFEFKTEVNYSLEFREFCLIITL